MTRISTMHPDWLTDRHLCTERFELLRVFTYVRRAVEKGKSPKDFNIPDKFTFGKGHVTFFYNKLGWLVKRFNDLTVEMKKRGLNVNLHTIPSWKLDSIPDEWFGNYTPTRNSEILSMQRISERIAAKPNLYPDAIKRMKLWR